VVGFTPQLLYPPVKSPRYPLDMRLSGHRYRSRRRGEEKNLSPYRVSNSKPSTVYPVASSYERGRVSTWVYKKKSYEVEKNLFTLHIPLSSTHLCLRCSNFFNPFKKKNFFCFPTNMKSQRLISTPKYTDCPLLSISYLFS
jgi:hypothetical protein